MGRRLVDAESCEASTTAAPLQKSESAKAIGSAELTSRIEHVLHAMEVGSASETCDARNFGRELTPNSQGEAAGASTLASAEVPTLAVAQATPAQPALDAPVVSLLPVSALRRVTEAGV